MTRRKHKELLAGRDDFGMVLIVPGAWGWCWYATTQRLGVRIT